jgi:hypothetical protein
MRLLLLPALTGLLLLAGCASTPPPVRAVENPIPIAGAPPSAGMAPPGTSPMPAPQ